MGNTAYVAFTNYGDGHNDAKAPAITQILKTSDSRVTGTNTFPVSVMEKNDELSFAIVRDGEARIGDQETPLQEAGGAEVDGDRVVGVDGYELLNLGEIQTRQNDVLQLRVSLTDDPADGWLRTDNGTLSYVAKSSLIYDEAADSFTSPEGKLYTANPERGLFVAEDGTSLQPGWRVVVGVDNFTAMFTDDRLSGRFFKIALWTFAFAVLSVLTHFRARAGTGDYLQ